VPPWRGCGALFFLHGIYYIWLSGVWCWCWVTRRQTDLTQEVQGTSVRPGSGGDAWLAAPMPDFQPLTTAGMGAFLVSRAEAPGGAAATDRRTFSYFVCSSCFVRGVTPTHNRTVTHPAAYLTLGSSLPWYVTRSRYCYIAYCDCLYAPAIASC